MNSKVDPTNFERLKNEFQNLYNSSNNISNSLLNYSLYIKDLYLSPNSLSNNIINSFNNQHPLNNYSKSIIKLYEKGILEWELDQSDNFKKVRSYSMELERIKINYFNRIEVLLKEDLKYNESKRNELSTLTKSSFSKTSLMFDTKVDSLDIPLINIQLSISSLFQYLNSIFINSTSLLQSTITPYNPILNIDQLTIKQPSFPFPPPPNLPLPIPLPVTLSQQIDNKYFDGKRFKLVKKFKKSVSIEFNQIFRYSDTTEFTRFSVFMTVPFTHSTQVIKKSSVSLHDPDTGKLLVGSIIDNTPLQQIYACNYDSRIHGGNRLNYQFKETIDADLYSTELIQVQDPNEQIKIEPITGTEIEVYTRPTSYCNFNTMEFTQFIQTNKLNQSQDESLLNFIYRVSIYIFKNIKYKSPYGHTGKPLDTINNGFGDCLCHSVLFASILRYNKIPCRIQFGRNVEFGKLITDHQNHIKNEWYNKDIGWIVYDGAFKDETIINNKKLFGNSNIGCGDFITFGLDYTMWNEIKIEGFSFTSGDYSFQNCCRSYSFKKSKPEEIEHSKTFIIKQQQ